MGHRLTCPHCGTLQDRWDQPRLTVDAVVTDPDGRILLVQRGLDPPGWALPGGFVDSGETLEAAAARELREETGLVAHDVLQFHTYSDPERDPRHHTVTTVCLARAQGIPRAGDDALDARFFPMQALPEAMAFDHRTIVEDVQRFQATGLRPQDPPPLP